MSRKDDIQKLIVNYERRLQKRKEQKALFGLDAPPHILTEIEDIEAEIKKLQTELEALEDSGVDEEPPRALPGLAEDTDPKQRIQLYLQGDFSSLLVDRRSAAIDAFAAVMGISPQAIEVYRVYEGSIVFDLGIPSSAVQRLRSLLQSNSAQLRLLKVEKVILEGETGEVEEWVIKEGKFDLVTSTRPMALGDDVSIKYGVFTLCFRTLLEHINEFNKLPRDSRLSWQKLAEHFEQVLRGVVYQSRPNDLAHGAQILIKGLGARREAIATFNPGAADIVEKMMAVIEHEAPTWQYKADVEKHRQYGETLARLFYEGTPWTRTQERLTTDAHIVFEYAGIQSTATQGQNTYGYKVAPMAYYVQYGNAEPDEPQENVIVLRFDFQHSFSTYLAYHFFFLHEYISHVYGANSGSDIFDDGWMMYVAYAFLVQTNRLLPVARRLKDAQMQAINEHCPGKLSGDLRHYYFLAQNLYSWLSAQSPQRFRQITWELAGYPLSTKNRFFHADFVERIRYHFDTRPDELIRKLTEYTNVDALLMQLPLP